MVKCKREKCPNWDGSGNACKFINYVAGAFCMDIDEYHASKSPVKEPEYRIVTPFSILDLASAGIPHNIIQTFQKQPEIKGAALTYHFVRDYWVAAAKRASLIDHLVDKGFIEEVIPKLTVGGFARHKINKSIYLITDINNITAAAIKVGGGGIYSMFIENLIPIDTPTELL